MPPAIRIAALALVALTAVASAEPVTVAGIVFPDRVGEFTRGGAIDHEKTNPGLGYSFPYRMEPWTATVYVYDQQRAAIPDDLGLDVVKGEFAQAKRDILGGRARRRVEPRRTSSATSRCRSAASLASCARAIRSSTRPMPGVTAFCALPPSKGKFVKFRITGARTGSPAPPRSRHFVAGWCRDLLAGGVVR